jgi:hypothetical protein
LIHSPRIQNETASELIGFLNEVKLGLRAQPKKICMVGECLEYFLLQNPFEKA